MKRKVVMVVSTIVFILSLVGVLSEQIEKQEAEQMYISLQEHISTFLEKEDTNSINATSVATSQIKEENLQAESIEKETEPVILDKFVELYTQNNDLVGWIDNGDSISYPIVQNMLDSNYYLHKDFYRNENKDGCIYIPNDITINDSIVLIYGHNMKSGSMFGNLDKYLEQSYFEEHPTIYLSSLYEEKELEVLGVFVSKVYEDDYTGFEYYNYRGDVTEQEFNEYLLGIEPLMQIGDISSVTYGDHLVELITCWYSEDNARLVVLCRQS